MNKLKHYSNENVFLFFSEQRPALRNFSVSPTQPDPLGYKIRNQNPILNCLVDQAQLDPEWSEKLKSGSDLLNGIIGALEAKTIQWPGMSSNVINSQEWIEKMKIDPTFYMNHAKTSQEMEAYERLLLELASRYLKRTIILHPFLDNDKELTFSQQSIPNTSPSTLTYNLLYVNKLWHDNFFLSVFPKSS